MLFFEGEKKMKLTRDYSVCRVVLLIFSWAMSQVENVLYIAGFWIMIGYFIYLFIFYWWKDSFKEQKRNKTKPKGENEPKTRGKTQKP